MYLHIFKYKCSFIASIHHKERNIMIACEFTCVQCDNHSLLSLPDRDINIQQPSKDKTGKTFPLKGKTEIKATAARVRSRPCFHLIVNNLSHAVRRKGESGTFHSAASKCVCLGEGTATACVRVFVFFRSLCFHCVQSGLCLKKAR